MVLDIDILKAYSMLWKTASPKVLGNARDGQFYVLIWD